MSFSSPHSVARKHKGRLLILRAPPVLTDSFTCLHSIASPSLLIGPPNDLNDADEAYSDFDTVQIMVHDSFCVMFSNRFFASTWQCAHLKS